MRNDTNTRENTIDSVHERHLRDYPGSTISAAELDYLLHIRRWGSAGYPVRKLGRHWFHERMFGAGGCPTPFKTKREAVAHVELYLSILRDKAAGREPGSGDPEAEEEIEITSEPRKNETREHAKGLRFLRSIKFPRFSMRAGEIWDSGFDPVHGLGSTARDYYAAVDSGDDRFDFAGGVCLVKDVELVFLSVQEIEQQNEVEAILRTGR